MINEPDLQTQPGAQAEAGASEAEAPLEAPAPHRAVKLQGVLCCGRATPRRRAQIGDIVLKPLTQLVHQVVEWSDPYAAAEDYLGDYRLLVIDVPDAAGTDAYVQIWSEPFEPLVLEVGPGNRTDALLQAVADRIREPLYDRGFVIGGGADNYRKSLGVPAGEDAPRIAREMLAIVLDVLGYEGHTDLGYRFQQDSNLRDAHVLNGIGRAALCTLLGRWGLRASPSTEEDTVIEAQSLEQEFTLQLNWVHTKPRGTYWEIHCLASLSLPAEAAAALVEKVNGRPYLLKAHIPTPSREPFQDVRLVAGINLAGGVTLAHIRAQITEFLQAVRKLSHHG